MSSWTVGCCGLFFFNTVLADVVLHYAFVPFMYLNCVYLHQIHLPRLEKHFGSTPVLFKMWRI